MTVRRIMPYHESADFDATRTFWTRVLGLEEGASAAATSASDPAQAQVVFAPPGVQPVLPDMGVDLDRAKPSTRRTPKPFGPGTRSSTARSTSHGASAGSSYAIPTGS